MLLLWGYLRVGAAHGILVSSMCLVKDVFTYSCQHPRYVIVKPEAFTIAILHFTAIVCGFEGRRDMCVYPEGP